MQFVPFAGLASALVLFLLSTRQFRFGLRLLIWSLGALLVAASIWIALADPQAHNLVAATFAHPYALLDAFKGNWQAVGAAFSPLLDVLCVASVIVALVCLIAFTPGDLTERAIRPIAIGLVGVVLGSTTALMVVGVGFGGASKRQVYIGVVAADDVHDGDTIFMGDVSLRIWGIDAPELNQPCAVPIPAISCGRLARQKLEDIIAGQLIVCSKPNVDARELRESFGRPLVRCIRQSDHRDIGREMVRSGCVNVYRDNGKVKSDYEKDEEDARNPRDAKRACPSFEQPDVWRRRR